MEKWRRRTGIEDRIQFSTFLPTSTVHSNPKSKIEFESKLTPCHSSEHGALRSICACTPESHRKKNPAPTPNHAAGTRAHSRNSMHHIAVTSARTVTSPFACGGLDVDVTCRMSDGRSGSCTFITSNYKSLTKEWEEWELPVWFWFGSV